MSDGRVITKSGRERAANESRSLRLGRTMMKIQDGASEKEIWDMAFSERLQVHSNCPCCRGAESVTRLVADHICSLLKDYPTDPSQTGC